MNMIDKINLSDAVVSSSLDAISPPLPLIILPAHNELDPVAWSKRNRNALHELLHEFGAVLLRGFNIETASNFQEVASALSNKLLDYKERSSPRNHVQGNVYTSTEYPADNNIFLHNEQSYNLVFPTKIFFYCSEPAKSGGNTPLADTRRIYNRVMKLGPKIKQLHTDGYKLNRHYQSFIGLQWNTVFQTSDKSKVERYCEQNHIEYKWSESGLLSTSQTRHCVAKHPVINVKCWFNHCTFFNINCLEGELKDMIKMSYSENELPNNTYFADGENIAESVIEEIMNCYTAEKREFVWHKNDFLFVDNVLTSHGRTKFSGNRKVLTIMSDPCDWETVV